MAATVAKDKKAKAKKKPKPKSEAKTVVVTRVGRATAVGICDMMPGCVPVKGVEFTRSADVKKKPKKKKREQGKK